MEVKKLELYHLTVLGTRFSKNFDLDSDYVVGHFADFVLSMFPDMDFDIVVVADHYNHKWHLLVDVL